jgi:formylglycine-generating enzyme required for sulfatase activity
MIGPGHIGSGFSPSMQWRDGMSTTAPSDMVRIPGGTFRMGSDRHYPEEAPAHRVTVAPFWIDRTPVTNRQFKQFVAATGYVTVAEIAPDPQDYPGALPHILKPGSLVFTPPSHPVDLRDWSQWWRFEFGADWRHPFGRGKPRAPPDHPVVHIAYQDAEAYATWAGKELPGEGGVGVCRAGPAGRRRVRLGRRADAWRTPHGEHVAGGVSAREPRH